MRITASIYPSGGGFAHGHPSSTTVVELLNNMYQSHRRDGSSFQVVSLGDGEMVVFYYHDVTVAPDGLFAPIEGMTQPTMRNHGLYYRVTGSAEEMQPLVDLARQWDTDHSEVVSGKAKIWLGAHPASEASSPA